MDHVGVATVDLRVGFFSIFFSGGSFYLYILLRGWDLALGRFVSGEDRDLALSVVSGEKMLWARFHATSECVAALHGGFSSSVVGLCRLDFHFTPRQIYCLFISGLESFARHCRVSVGFLLREDEEKPCRW